MTRPSRPVRRGSARAEGLVEEDIVAFVSGSGRLGCRSGAYAAVAVHLARPSSPRRMRAAEIDTGFAGFVPSRAVALSNVLLEERDRPLPRQLGRLRVVARRGVVVEAVLRPRIEVALVPDVVRLERLLERRPARVDARIRLGRLDHQRSLDLRDVLDVWG